MSTFLYGLMAIVHQQSSSEILILMNLTTIYASRHTSPAHPLRNWCLASGSSVIALAIWYSWRTLECSCAPAIWSRDWWWVFCLWFLHTISSLVNGIEYHRMWFINLINCGEHSIVGVGSIAEVSRSGGGGHRSAGNIRCWLVEVVAWVTLHMSL